MKLFKPSILITVTILFISCGKENVKEIKVYENNTYNREKEEPQYVTLNKTKMNINESKIRIPVE